jgi:hypothetical protein
MILPVGRTIAIILILSSTAGLACGCGGSDSASTASRDSGADAAATGATTVSEHAVALAHAINLRAADVPTMKVYFPEHVNQSGPMAQGLTRCGGAVLTGEVGGIHSPLFKRGLGPTHQALRSIVRVMPSAGIAERNVAATNAASVQSCIARDAEKQTGWHQRVTAAPLPTLLAGVPGSFGVRLVVLYPHLHGARRFSYKDFLGFASGPAEITLETTRYARPFSTATERRLLALLWSRAKANTAS